MTNNFVNKIFLNGNNDFCINNLVKNCINCTSDSKQPRIAIVKKIDDKFEEDCESSSGT